MILDGKFLNSRKILKFLTNVEFNVQLKKLYVIQA